MSKQHPNFISEFIYWTTRKEQHIPNTKGAYILVNGRGRGPGMQRWRGRGAQRGCAVISMRTFFLFPTHRVFLFLSVIPFCVHFCTFALECLPGLGFVFRGTPRVCVRARPEGASRESERPNSARRGGEGSIPPSLCGIVVELLNKVHCTA